MRAVALGHKGALDVLLDRYMQMVERTSYRILCDRGDSDDVTFAVFLKICRDASDFDDRQNLSFWLYRLTCGLCRSRMRRRRLSDLLYIAPSLYETSAPLPHSPEEDYITKEAWEIFCRASRNMSFTQRIVFTISELEQLPMAEVEEITGLSAGQIKDNLRTARKLIRSELEVYGKVR